MANVIITVLVCSYVIFNIDLYDGCHSAISCRSAYALALRSGFSTVRFFVLFPKRKDRLNSAKFGSDKKIKGGSRTGWFAAQDKRLYLDGIAKLVKRYARNALA